MGLSLSESVVMKGFKVKGNQLYFYLIAKINTNITKIANE